MFFLLFLSLLVCVSVGVVPSDEVKSLPGWTSPLPSKQYSGLLEVPHTSPNTRHYHYWLVQSENDPVNDPIVFWFNGGPGASSLLGYFIEQGPFNVNDNSIQNNNSVPNLFYNNYTWAKVCNIVFLESPAGVGFSYCDGNEGPINSCPNWNDTLVAQDNHAIIQQFFKAYPEYLNNGFYIAGESYAGIYVPTLVMQIENDPSGMPPLLGFAVGDGCMGIGGMGGCNDDSAYNFYQFMWGHGQLSNDIYNNILTTCNSCLIYGNCSAQNIPCVNYMAQAQIEMGGFDVYNIYDQCYLEGDMLNNKEPMIFKDENNNIRFNLKYAFNGKMTYNSLGSGINQYACGGMTVTSLYLNNDSVKRAINVPNIPWTWQDGGWSKYTSTQTDLRPYYNEWVKKYRVLIYYGDTDSAVPYIGGEKWTENLGYPILEKWRPWTQNGYNLMGGYIQTYNVGNNGQFIFLTVRGAGHEVPQYKPSQALSMFKFWLRNEKFPVYTGVPNLLCDKQSNFRLSATLLRPMLQKSYDFVDVSTAELRRLTSSTSVDDGSINESEKIENKIDTINDSIIDNKKEQLSLCKLLQTLLGGAIGNLLEWFDFALFGLLANEIGSAFFPPGNSTVHLFEVFSLFAGSYLVRPLGGIIFGYLGDKYGRLYALRISILLMAGPTFLIGCLPSYESIGILSTIIIVLLRLIQGISAGGELTGALVYVVEICPKKYKSLFAVLVQVSGCGIILASLVISSLRYIFSDEAITNYAWRIPFLSGIFLLIFGLYIRKFLNDSSEFLQIKKAKKILKNPVLFIMKNAKLELIILVLSRSFSSVTYYTFFVWVPNYLQSENLRKNEDYVIKNPYTINTIALVLSYISMVFSGWLGDKYRARNIIGIFGIIFLLSIIILFPLVEESNDSFTIGIELIVLSICFGLYGACLEVFSVNIFYNNVNIRFTALGIGYNISSGVFGGLSPLLATTCVKYINISGYSWILFLFGCNSLLFMYFKDYLLKIRDNYYQNKIGSNNKKYQKIFYKQNEVQFFNS